MCVESKVFGNEKSGLIICVRGCRTIVQSFAMNIW
jgi:hypothetical protein